MLINNFSNNYEDAMERLDEIYVYLCQLDKKISSIIDILDIIFSDEINQMSFDKGTDISESVGIIKETLNLYLKDIVDFERDITKFRIKLEPYFELQKENSIKYYTLLNEVQILINIYKPIIEDKIEVCKGYFNSVNSEI